MWHFFGNIHYIISKMQVGRENLFSNRTVQTTSIISGKELFVLLSPPVFHWTLFASCGTLGKNRVCVLLSFSLIKFVIYWKLKYHPPACMINAQEASSSFGPLSHQWEMEPYCLPYTWGLPHTTHIQTGTRNAYAHSAHLQEHTHAHQSTLCLYQPEPTLS